MIIGIQNTMIKDVIMLYGGILANKDNLHAFRY